MEKGPVQSSHGAEFWVSYGEDKGELQVAQYLRKRSSDRVPRCYW